MRRLEFLGLVVSCFGHATCVAVGRKRPTPERISRLPTSMFVLAVQTATTGCKPSNDSTETREAYVYRFLSIFIFTPAFKLDAWGLSTLPVHMACSIWGHRGRPIAHLGGPVGNGGSLDPLAIGVVRASVGSLGRFGFGFGSDPGVIVPPKALGNPSRT
jgi:hypothetical protein